MHPRKLGSARRGTLRDFRSAQLFGTALNLRRWAHGLVHLHDLFPAGWRIVRQTALKCEVKSDFRRTTYDVDHSILDMPHVLVLHSLLQRRGGRELSLDGVELDGRALTMVDGDETVNGVHLPSALITVSFA